jgi:DNA-binding NtrC family response regulator
MTPISFTEAAKAGLREAKRRVIIEALEVTGGNRTHAAARLQITRPYLLSQMKALNISVSPAPRETWDRRAKRTAADS